MRPLESISSRTVLVALSWLLPAIVVVAGHVVDMTSVLQLGGVLLVGRSIYAYKEMEEY